MENNKQTVYKCGSCGNTSNEEEECCGAAMEKNCDCGSGEYSKNCCGS